MRIEVTLTVGQIMLGALWIIGVVLMLWALVQESHEKSPIYVRILTVATLLSLSVTFISAFVSTFPPAAAP